MRRTVLLNLNDSELQKQVSAFATQIAERMIASRMEGTPVQPTMFTFEADGYAQLHPAHCYELEEPMEISVVKGISAKEEVDAWVLIYMGEYYDWTLESGEAELLIPTPARTLSESVATVDNPSTPRCLVTLVESEFSSYTLVRALLEDGSFGNPTVTMTPRMGSLAGATKNPVVIN
jgi:hypothetical protein